MLVTDVGMAALVNERHALKALDPMLVTDGGIVTLVSSSLFTLHSFHESGSSGG